MTYWMLNAIFLAVVLVLALAAVFAGRRRGSEGVAWRAVLLTTIILLVMTAGFDNIMIAIGLVDYNPELTAATRLGVAPLEDFAYTIAAVVLLPSIWVLAASRSNTRNTVQESRDV